MYDVKPINPMTELLPNIWAVRVPKDAMGIDVYNGEESSIDYYSHSNNPGMPYEILLPPGNYSLIGVGISEELAGKIVDRYDEHCINCCYRDCTREEVFASQFVFDTATDSLISLLKSKGLNTEDNYVFIKLND